MSDRICPTKCKRPMIFTTRLRKHEENGKSVEIMADIWLCPAGHSDPWGVGADPRIPYGEYTLKEMRVNDDRTDAAWLAKYGELPSYRFTERKKKSNS